MMLESVLPDDEILKKLGQTTSRQSFGAATQKINDIEICDDDLTYHALRTDSPKDPYRHNRPYESC
jgi:hypothetical protein